jgi:hypothetical protein
VLHITTIPPPTNESHRHNHSQSQRHVDLCLQSDERTWHSCFGCWFSFVNLTSCGLQLQSLTDSEYDGCVDESSFDPLDVSNYAAQLAWWLSFFPAERFLVLPSSALRNSAKQTEVRLHPP